MRLRTSKQNEEKSNKQSGFTLIEVMIAIGVLAIGILAMGSMQVRSVKGNSYGRDLTEATALAETRLEMLMCLPYDHPLLDDTTGDGSAGLRHPLPPLPAQPIPDTGLFPADQPPAGSPLGAQDSYRVFWNVAEDDVIDNTKTINLIIAWSHHLTGETRSILLEYFKAR